MSKKPIVQIGPSKAWYKFTCWYKLVVMGSSQVKLSQMRGKWGSISMKSGSMSLSRWTDSRKCNYFMMGPIFSQDNCGQNIGCGTRMAQVSTKSGLKSLEIIFSWKTRRFWAYLVTLISEICLPLRENGWKSVKPTRYNLELIWWGTIWNLGTI